MASQCVSLAVCKPVFTLRVVDRVTVRAVVRMSDEYTPTKEGSSLTYKVSARCPLISQFTQCAVDMCEHYCHIPGTVYM